MARLCPKAPDDTQCSIWVREDEEGVERVHACQGDHEAGRCVCGCDLRRRAKGNGLSPVHLVLVDPTGGDFA